MRRTKMHEKPTLAAHLFLSQDHSIQKLFQRDLEVFDPLLLEPRDLRLDELRHVIECLLSVKSPSLGLHAKLVSVLYPSCAGQTYICDLAERMAKAL